MFSTLGDIMNTVGDITSTPEGYHDKCGGRPLGKPLNLYGNPSVLTIPRRTHDIPQCTHGIPSVLNTLTVLTISPHSLCYPPLCSWYPQTVLNTPRCTHDVPNVLNTPDVLNDIPQCTEHPPVY